MKTLTCVCAIALSVGLGACGGGDATTSNSGAEHEIEAVIAKYELATKKHDAEMFCTEVLPNEQNPANGEDPKKCPPTIKAVMSDPSSELSSAQKVDVLGYEFDGDTATVKAKINGKPKTLTFTNGENGWRLSSFA
jgi:hypothetical protein